MAEAVQLCITYCNCFIWGKRLSTYLMQYFFSNVHYLTYWQNSNSLKRSIKDHGGPECSKMS